MQQIVEFVQTKMESVPFEYDDKYKFRKDKKYHLVQKVCLWVLDKIGAKANGVDTVYNKTVFNSNYFMEKVFTQMDNAQRVFDIRPDILLIGESDFRDIVGSKDINQIMVFDYSYNYNRELLGLKVCVVPWMKGYLALRKKDLGL